jgi:hypothetical protein
MVSTFRKRYNLLKPLRESWQRFNFFKKGEASNLQLLKKLYKTAKDPKKYLVASPLHYGNLFNST